MAVRTHPAFALVGRRGARGAAAFIACCFLHSKMMASLKDRNLIDLAKKAYEYELISGIERADSHLVVWKNGWVVELSPAGAEQFLQLLVRGYEKARQEADRDP